jgi:hypothetical protein
MPARMLGRSGLLLAILICGCGGAGAPAPDPKTPDEIESPTPPGDAPPSSESPSDAQEPDATPPKDEAPAAAAEPLSAQDLEAVLQQLMDDPEMSEYLKLKKPGRLPLKVSGEGLPAKLSVIIGSHDLKVVGEPKSKKDPVLVFTKIERDGESVRLRYRFDAEAITGSAVVHRKGGTWRLGANRVLGK